MLLEAIVKVVHLSTVDNSQSNLHETSILLYSSHDTGILIPCQHRVFTVPRLGFLKISPPLQKFFMAHYPRELPCHRPIDGFHYWKVRWEEDVKIALLYLMKRSVLPHPNKQSTSRMALPEVFAPAQPAFGTSSAQPAH